MENIDQHLQYSSSLFSYNWLLGSFHLENILSSCKKDVIQLYNKNNNGTMKMFPKVPGSSIIWVLAWIIKMFTQA